MSAASGGVANANLEVQASRQASTPTARRPGWSRPRWHALACWLATSVAFFACYLQLARTRTVDSDGASQALQAWDMLHGNVLLHGWWLSDVSFYTTELPEYLLVELVRGLHADVVPIAAALTYTLAALLAALVAKGTTTGRVALVRAVIAVGIMLVPQLGQGVKILISSPDHVGTSVPVLAAWLILDRGRPRWYVPVAAAAVLGWALVADSLVLFVGVLPVVLVCLFRIGRAAVLGRNALRTHRYEICLLAAVLVASGAAELALRSLRAAGGFVVQPPAAQLVSGFSGLAHGLNVTGQGLLLLAGADVLSAGPAGAASVIVWLHLVGLLLAGLGVCLAARRFVGELALVDQLLLAGVVINLAAYAFSTQSTSPLVTREIAIVLPLSAVLAGRMLADRILAWRGRLVLLVVLSGYLAGLGYGLVQPTARPQGEQLTSWLVAHHLRSGLAGYWQANVVTVTSGDDVGVRPIQSDDTRATIYQWESNSGWYNPRRASANFVVLTAGSAEYPGLTDKRAVRATFGPPTHIYHVGDYEVWTYSGNLLGDLVRG